MAAMATLTRRDEAQTIQEMSRQWTNPAGVLGVIMLVGGDIVQKAMANLAGMDLFVPVCFSFGWIPFAVTNVILLAGDGQLMPAPDTDCMVINCDNGYTRANRSFLLGRLLRDSEETRESGALSIVVKRAVGEQNGNPPTGISRGLGTAWYISTFLIAVQFGIAAIPWGLYGDWSTFILCAAGTLLALFTGALPQWRAEKYGCKDSKSKKTFAIMRGNGSRHVLIVLGNGGCLDFESLAAAQSPRFRSTWKDYGMFRQVKPDPNAGKPESAGKVDSSAGKTYATTAEAKKPEYEAVMLGNLPLDLWFSRVVNVILAILWLLLLLTVSGLTQNAWFLLLVGAIGMVQNATVAAMPRSPARIGLHFETVETIKGNKVMDALMDLERQYPGHCDVLLSECRWPVGMTNPVFPGRLFPEETAWWKLAEMRRMQTVYDNAKPGKPKPKPDWDSVNAEYGSREELEAKAAEYDDKRLKTAWRHSEIFTKSQRGPVV